MLQVAESTRIMVYPPPEIQHGLIHIDTKNDGLEDKISFQTLLCVVSMFNFSGVTAKVLMSCHL